MIASHARGLLNEVLFSQGTLTKNISLALEIEEKTMVKRLFARESPSIQFY